MNDYNICITIVITIISAPSPKKSQITNNNNNKTSYLNFITTNCYVVYTKAR